MLASVATIRPPNSREQTLATRIEYLIAYKGENEAYLSPFRGFQLVSLRTCAALQIIAALPSDVRQYRYDAGALVGFRAAGVQACNVRFCPVAHLKALLDQWFPQFLVVFFEPGLETALEEQVGAVSSGHPALLVEMPSESDAMEVAATIPVFRQALAAFVKGAVAELARSRQQNIAQAFAALARAKRPLRRKEPARWECVPIRSLLPSHTVLSTMGYELTSGAPLRSLQNEPYLEAIAHAAEAVLREREKLIAAKKGPLIRIENDLVLAAPTMYSELRLEARLASDWAGATGVPLQDPAFRRIVQILAGQKGFVFGEALAREDAKLMQSELGTMLLRIFTEELGCFAAYASLLAADSQAPALHWAPDVAHAYEPLVRFVRHYRAKEAAIAPIALPPGAAAVQADPETVVLFAAVQEALAQATPQRYLDLLRRSGSAKILADLPLEWLDIDGLPLMLARETSRVPVTPGMLMRAEPTPPPMLLPRSSCRKVLIVTTYDEATGESSDLVTAVREAELGFLEPEVRLARRPTDVLDALARFDGPLVIFDMHGAASEQDLFGELLLPTEETFSPYRHLVRTSEGMWQRSFDVRVPPIVVLSACDTLAVDSPSGSAASAFLLGGAYTVLATFLPVFTIQGGGFVGRLLRRYDEFLRMSKRNHPVRWRQLVWDTQRLAYLTELFFAFALETGGKLSSEFVRFGVETAETINNEDPRFPGGREWYDRAVALLAEMSVVSPDSVRSIVRDRLRFADAMNYVQVGFPERVIILSDNFELFLPHLAQMQWSDAVTRPRSATR